MAAAPGVSLGPVLCVPVGLPVFAGTVAFPLDVGNLELADAITVCTTVERDTEFVESVSTDAVDVRRTVDRAVVERPDMVEEAMADEVPLFES